VWATAVFVSGATADDTPPSVALRRAAARRLWNPTPRRCNAPRRDDHTSSVAADTPPRVYDLLTACARDLVDAVDGVACVISRMIGDVLVMVAEHAPGGRTLQLGQGYLVSDYPATQVVLDRREPALLSLEDEDVDPAEAALLREFGFSSLLMLPLVLKGDVWGLVEVYRADGPRFEPADAQAAERVLAEATAPLQEL
jgi:GAF domain-containing protein